MTKSQILNIDVLQVLLELPEDTHSIKLELTRGKAGKLTVTRFVEDEDGGTSKHTEKYTVDAR